MYGRPRGQQFGSLQLTKRRPPLALLSNSSSSTLNDRFSLEMAMRVAGPNRLSSATFGSWHMPVRSVKSLALVYSMGDAPDDTKCQCCCSDKASQVVSDYRLSQVMKAGQRGEVSSYGQRTRG